MRTAWTLLLAGALAAQAPETSSAELANRFLDARAKGDAAAMRALAKSASSWLIADDLCIRGQHDAATAYAAQVAGRDADKLRAYVASRKDAPDRKRARRKLAEGYQAMARRDFPAVLKVIESIDTTPADVLSARATVLRTKALLSAFRHREAYAAAMQVTARAEKLGWEHGIGFGLGTATDAALWSKNWAAVRKAGRRQVAFARSRGDRATEAGTLINIGSMYLRIRNLTRARQLTRDGYEIACEIGHKKWRANAASNLGVIYRNLGQFDKATAMLEEATALQIEIGDRAGLGLTYQTLSNVKHQTGDLDASFAAAKKAYDIVKETGSPIQVNMVTIGMGLAEMRAGRYEKALRYFDESVAAQEGFGNPIGQMQSFHHKAIVLYHMGHYAGSRAAHQRCLELAKRHRTHEMHARALRGLGQVDWIEGRNAEALTKWEACHGAYTRAGNPIGASLVLHSLASAYSRLADPDRAFRAWDQILEVVEKTRDEIGLASTLINYGAALSSRDFERGEAMLRRGIAVAKQHQHEDFVANGWMNLGVAQRRVGRSDDAAVSFRRALEIREKAPFTVELGQARVNLMELLTSTGRVEESVALGEQLLRDARSVGSAELEICAAKCLADAHYLQKRFEDAIRISRAAVPKIALVLGHLGDEDAARARQAYGQVLGTGFVASLHHKDLESASFFAENSRANGLLEMLGGRRELGSVALPADVTAEERSARAAVEAARDRLDKARKMRKRRYIKRTREELKQAQARLLETAERVQRVAKVAASVALPQTLSLEELQSELRAGEALLTYVAIPDRRIAASVVTRDKAWSRILELPRGPLRFADPNVAVDAQAIAALREAVVEPLDMPDEIRRVLVSPAAALSYVPFTVLMPEREIAYVPSGSVAAMLRKSAGVRGERILAIGDPTYGGALPQLPNTRVEAEAIGDEAILGNDATEATVLTKIAATKRWRAVHFACHGNVDIEQPKLSSLALTPNDASDGKLTALEILRSKMSCDLAVLSACETGRGKVYRSEGILGFTRAFFCAGASRVIVSLWKVDDEATRALMIRFYELWNPKDTKAKPRSAAAALRAAQRHVRAQKKWSHPYYWAAWQLWGLAD